MLEEIGAFADSIGKACAQGKGARFICTFFISHRLEYCAQWNAAIATLESMRKTHFLGFSVGLQKNLSTLSTYMNEFYDAHHRMVCTRLTQTILMSSSPNSKKLRKT